MSFTKLQSELQKFITRLKAMLVQQDIRDTNNNLIAPWQMQDKFCLGTIVVMDMTLVCRHIFARGMSKVYNVCITYYETHVLVC